MGFQPLLQRPYHRTPVPVLIAAAACLWAISIAVNFAK
jgi:hypothetical protein